MFNLHKEMYPGVDYTVAIKRIDYGPDYQITISRIDNGSFYSFTPFTYQADETLSLIRVFMLEGYSIVPVI